MSPDGKFLAAGSAARRPTLQLAEKKLVATLKEHDNWVLSVSPDGKWLATAGADKFWRIWDVKTWKPNGNRLRQDDPIRRYLAIPCGHLALAIGGRNECRVRCRATTDEVLAMLETGMALDLVSLAPPRNRLYVAGSDKTVKVFDTAKWANWEPIATLRGHGDWVYGLARQNATGTRLRLGQRRRHGQTGNVADNSLLATLVQLAPQSDQWLFSVTAQGYFDTSTTAAIQWRDAGRNRGGGEIGRFAEPGDGVNNSWPARRRRHRIEISNPNPQQIRTQCSNLKTIAAAGVIRSLCRLQAERGGLCLEHLHLRPRICLGFGIWDWGFCCRLAVLLLLLVPLFADRAQAAGGHPTAFHFSGGRAYSRQRFPKSWPPVRA